MPPLTLTILGAGPAAPNSGGVCSGYLVQDGDANVLLDCGSGVAGRLLTVLPAHRLRGVAISHLHPDHYFDLVPLYYLLRFGSPRPGAGHPGAPAGAAPAERGARVPLLVPPGGRDFLRRFAALISGEATMLDDMFEVRDYVSGGEVDLDGLRLSFHPVQHYILSHAIRVRGADGRVLVFSSDVAPCAALVHAARDADLLLCESALLDRAQDRPDPAQRGHLLAAEAGAAAREAGARRLLLTHYRAGPTHSAFHRQAAEAAFGAEVELAEEGRSYAVG